MNPKLPPPARVGADDVKALPEPECRYATDRQNIEFRGYPIDSDDRLCAIIPVRTKPTKAQLREAQRLLNGGGK